MPSEPDPSSGPVTQGPVPPGRGAWPLARVKHSPAPLPIEHESPPPRSGPPWWCRALKWLFYRDAPQARSSRRALPAGPLMLCPQCESRQGVSQEVCGHCGFPFICALDQRFEDERLRRRSRGRERWRLLLGIATLVFILTNGALIAGSSAQYEGHSTQVIASIQPASPSRVQISGPQVFVTRTRLALGLLQARAPAYYHRIEKEVASIEYLPAHVLEEDDGSRLNLEGIGAVALPHERRVLVLVDTAFPSGLAELWDRDVFIYAGVLVHELRHIELHYNGENPGTVEEEVLCEQAAYDALKAAQAPGGVLARYEMYFANPHARRYQRWYDFYQQ